MIVNLPTSNELQPEVLGLPIKTSGKYVNGLTGTIDRNGRLWNQEQKQDI